MCIHMHVCIVLDQLSENNLIDMDSTKNIVKSGLEMQDFMFPQCSFWGFRSSVTAWSYKMKAPFGYIQNYLLNDKASYPASHEPYDFHLTYSQVNHRYDNQARQIWTKGMYVPSEDNAHTHIQMSKLSCQSNQRHKMDKGVWLINTEIQPHDMQTIKLKSVHTDNFTFSLTDGDPQEVTYDYCVRAVFLTHHLLFYCRK